MNNEVPINIIEAFTTILSNFTRLILRFFPSAIMIITAVFLTVIGFLYLLFSGDSSFIGN